MNIHNPSPPEKAMFSWPEKLNDVRIAAVNLKREYKFRLFGAI